MQSRYPMHVSNAEEMYGLISVLILLAGHNKKLIIDICRIDHLSGSESSFVALAESKETQRLFSKTSHMASLFVK